MANAPDPKGHGTRVIVNTHETRPFTGMHNSLSVIHQPKTGYFKFETQEIDSTKTKRGKATARVLVQVDGRKNKPGLVTVGGKDRMELPSDYAHAILTGNASGPVPKTSAKDPAEKRIDQWHHNGFLVARDVLEEQVGSLLTEKQMALAKVEAELEAKAKELADLSARTTVERGTPKK